MTKILLAAVTLVSMGYPVQDTDACCAVATEPASTSALIVESPAGSSPTLTVPAETEAAVCILSAIHTGVNHVDDPVVAQLLGPVLVDGKVALPAGTLVDGRITRLRPAGRLHRSAEVALRFERVELPDGDVEPIRAELAVLDDSSHLGTRVDSEGYLKGGSAMSRRRIAPVLAGLSVLGTAKLVAGATSLWVALPAGAAGWLGYEYLWRRGSEVHVPPRTSGRIRLDYPLTVRVLW